MRNVEIKNFRCYENKSIEFRSGINLLIGDNSVGKTSLLRACNLVMNAFFSGYSDENTVWKSADDNDFRDTGIAELPVEISFQLGSWDLPQINGVELGTDLVFKIEKKSKKNSRNLVTGLVELRNHASQLQKRSHEIVDGEIRQSIALPLYACFTTEDIHTVRKFDKNKFKKHIHKPSFGYYESFDCKGLMECWIKRLLVLKEAKVGEDEINNVRNAIIEALGPNGCNVINDMEIRYNDGNVYFHFVDGRTAAADLLSDGYRRLINIVMDIAFRSALLNKAMYGDQSYKHTFGTVIIDEIDEHLHPALQVRVLKALQMTFSKIQFIVSTHSPLVMSSVENSPENVVYKLEYENDIYSHHELNTYGLDASTIMHVYMDQAPRDLVVDNEIKNIESLIDAEKYAEARIALNKMLERPGSDANPELSRIEATLSFYED